MATSCSRGWVALGWKAFRIAAVALALLTAGSEAGRAAPARPAAAGASLIYCGWFGNTIPTPTFIRNNKAFLETQPFHGIVAYLRDDSTGLNATSRVMTANSISAAQIAGILAPMKGQTWSTLKKNFGLVQGSSPPDPFDDWSVMIQNFANCAAALKDAGFVGICFDNEQYSSPWGDYPSGAKYYATKTLNDYRSQMRLRGKQVMEAMVAVFPDIAVITLHGAYVSEPSAPSSLGFPQWQSGNELLGPYYAGFMEGVGTSPALNVDGGELYDLRTPAQFLNTYNWRKYDEASAAVNSPFIPQSLRDVWSERMSVSYGVYDRPFGGASMDPTILKSTLINALAQADHYVWFYTEGASFLLPSSSGGASAAWVDAVRQAIGAAPPAPAGVPAPTAVQATASSSDQIDLYWTSTAQGLTGFTLERKTGPAGTWSEISKVGAALRSFPDVTVDPGTTYVYRVQAVAGTSSSPFSGEATATTPSATPGPSPDPTPSPAPSSSKSGGSGGGGCGLLGLEAAAVLVLAGFLSKIRRTG